MRTLLQVTVPVEKGNSAIADGTLPDAIKTFMDAAQPEAAYFFASQAGQRSALFVFDLKDTSDIPPLSEPFFSALNASIVMVPCMNLDDLQKALSGMAS